MSLLSQLKSAHAQESTPSPQVAAVVPINPPAVCTACGFSNHFWMNAYGLTNCSRCKPPGTAPVRSWLIVMQDSAGNLAWVSTAKADADSMAAYKASLKNRKAKIEIVERFPGAPPGKDIYVQLTCGRIMKLTQNKRAKSAKPTSDFGEDVKYVTYVGADRWWTP